MKTPTKRTARRLGGVLIVCVACAAAVAGQGSAFLNSAAAVSPDGSNELRLEVGEGEWKTEAFEDAPDADKNAERYIRRLFTIKAGEPLKVRLAPGGGFAARLVPMANKR